MIDFYQLDTVHPAFTTTVNNEVLYGDSSFGESGSNPLVWPFKWNFLAVLLHGTITCIR